MSRPSGDIIDARGCNGFGLPTLAPNISIVAAGLTFPASGAFGPPMLVSSPVPSSRSSTGLTSGAIAAPGSNLSPLHPDFGSISPDPGVVSFQANGNKGIGART